MKEVEKIGDSKTKMIAAANIHRAINNLRFYIKLK
jgi:hypothetical protein